MLDLMVKINDLIDKEYESVKAESGTYRELRNKLEKMEKDLAYEKPLLAHYIGGRFHDLLDAETGAIKIRNQEAKIKGITVDLCINNIQEAEGDV